MYELLGDAFPWIVALYLADGLAQLGRGHVAFVRGLGPFRVRRAGLHLLGLSPLDEAIAAHDLPFLVSERAVHLFDPRRRTDPALVAAADLEAIPFEAVLPVAREGRKVTVAGRLALVAPTPEWAERAREDLSLLAAAAPGKRLEAAAALARPRLDAGAVASFRERQRAFSAPLRAAAAFLFAGTFGLWPLAAFGPPGLRPPAGALLAGLGWTVLLVGALTALLLRAAGERPWRCAATALHGILYPVAALRPLLHATRGLHSRFEAAAIAAAVLPRAAFAALAGCEIRRARLSSEATDRELAPFWEARERALLRLVADAGLREEEALAPPARAAGAAVWCPLCGAQYRAGFERCRDCGVPAVPFAQAKGCAPKPP